MTVVGDNPIGREESRAARGLDAIQPRYSPTVDDTAPHPCPRVNFERWFAAYDGVRNLLRTYDPMPPEHVAWLEAHRPVAVLMRQAAEQHTPCQHCRGEQP